MGDFEILTQNSLRLRMDEDPCVVCGLMGHTAWGNCKGLTTPIATDSPLKKIYGPNSAFTARRTIVKYRGMPRPEPVDPVQNAVTGQDHGTEAESSRSQLTHDVAEAEDKLLNDRLTQVPTTVDGLKKVREISQAETVERVAAEPANIPETAELSRGNAFKPTPTVSKAKKANYPLRKEFALPSAQEVFTNHFEVSFKPQTRFFVYEILKMPTGKTKRKSKFIFKTAIEAWDFLRDNKQHFTTDYANTIVAWKDLHSTMNCHRIIEGAKETQIGAVWMPDAIADGTERVQMFVKLHRELDLAGLEAYIDAKNTSSDPDFDINPIVDALNIAITSSLSDNVFQQSTNKFFVKHGHERLTGGANLVSLCTIRGYYYTIKPAMQKVLLNVNAATSAFFRPITVADYLKDKTFTWDERLKFLKTLRVYIEPDRMPSGNPDDQEHEDHLNKPQNRIKTFCGFGPQLKDKSMSFRKTSKDDQGQWVQAQHPTRVVDHMKKVFGRDFSKDSDAINVGTEEDPVYYPAEYLRILPYQMYKRLLPDSVVEDMLKQATHLPKRSRQLIEVEAMESLGLNPKQVQQEIPGCPQLLVKPAMLKIPSTQMNSLEIIYGANTTNQKPNANAQWDLRALKAFLEAPGNSSIPKKRFNYILLAEDGLSPDTIKTYKTTFNELLTKYGVCGGAEQLATRIISNIRDQETTYSALKGTIFVSMQSMLQTKQTANLAILLLKSRSIPVYCAFKDITDRSLPMQSLCLTQAPNMNPVTKSCKSDISQYMANIMMKANLKLGGGNHTVQLAGRPETRIASSLQGTLVLGADLTHPSSNSLTGCPSIAAVVGSVNSSVTKFLGSMRLQKTCKKEIIDDLQAMVTERIRAYVSVTRQPPTKILFFRDGVSTSQFAQVRDQELPQIKDAFRSVYPDSPVPKITLVVAVKRHHTRFYPAVPVSNKTGNCAPGTLVDRAVVSPHYSDFFLQSHHGLKGTAIPTHYVVIANEMNLAERALQELTWKLCYTYVRATVGVSYAPPAYYADRLCDRGRAYLRDWFSPDRDSEHYTKYLEIKRKVEQEKLGGLKKEIEALPVVAPRPGRNAAKKSQAQIDAERRHHKAVEKAVEAEVLRLATDEFERTRKGGHGPWDASLDETMFWM